MRKCLEKQQYFNLVDTLLDDSLARINSYLVSKPCGCALSFKCFFSRFVSFYICGVTSKLSLNVSAASNSRQCQIG
jgi:hypothetical protein